MAFEKAEVIKLQTYLQKKFGQPTLTLKDRKTNDSLEVVLNGEFLGVIYKDEEDGETSYDFNMAILDMDLEEVA